MHLLKLGHLKIESGVVLPKFCSLRDLIECVLEFQLGEIIVEMSCSLRLVVKVSNACSVTVLYYFLSFWDLLLVYFFNLLYILE